MPTFELENGYPGVIAGVDEAGLGPLAGPMVVCACIINSRNLDEFLLLSINDSKQLSHKKREKIFDIITNNDNFIYNISIISSDFIDQNGLSYSWKYGVIKSITGLKIQPDVCLIDGNRQITIADIQTNSVIKGDQKSYSIASASIIAKVTRDRIMQKIHEEFPAYGFNKHVGYGTQKHLEALKRFGVTKYHRKSYKPISNLDV